MQSCQLPLTICMSLCLYAAFSPALFARQTGDNQLMTTDTTILSSLRDEHPRLIALDEDVRAVASLLRSPDGAQWEEHLIRAGELAITAPPVEHVLTGPRLLAQSRAALERITLLAFLHRLRPDQRYVDRVALEMETACAFPDWNPSHFLDTAEMTAAMASGYDWLYSDLTTETRTVVREGIIRHGLAPGLKIYQSDTWWVHGRNNWNHVCNGGLMIGALAIADEEPEIAAAILNYGKDSLARGMELFAPDGGWLEASGYWVYTMKYTARILSALNTSLGTAFGLDQSEGFENTGYFMLAMEGPTGKHFNWGDGAEKFGNLPELYFLAQHFDQPVIAWLAEKHAGGTPRIFDLIWHVQKTKNPKENTKLDWFFDGIEVGSMRSGWDDPNATFVAYKGGDNMAPHSNNDLGTFVFDTDGERWALELGGDDYNLPGYWSRTKRLAYYRIRTEGQNTLVINGKEQNIRGTSEIVHRGSNETSAFAVADLTEGYAGSAEKVMRGFMLTGNDSDDSARRHLVIQDEVQSSGTVDINWYMHTQADVQIEGRTATMTIGDSTAKLKVLEPTDAKLTVASAEQKPPQRSNKGISRIAVNHKQDSGSARIVIQISPSTSDDFTYEPNPLTDWK